MTYPPIFIIGCPRSGTSLLARLLGPTKYGTPIETHFITKFYKKYKKYGDLKQKQNVKALVKAILRERPVMQWKLNIDIDKLREGQQDYDYRELVHNLCMIRSNAMGKQSWGDKTPQYILDLDIIYNLFPDSKYVYIVRDGRDVALSLLKKPWGQNNIYSCAEYWKRCNQNSRVLDLIRDKGNLIDIKYEDLLKNPKDIVEKLYAFLGEKFSDTSLKTVMASISRSNLNKWKTQMKPKEVKLFEMVAANTLKRLGYETSFSESTFSNVENLFWKTHDYIFYCRHLAKLNLIDTIRIKYFGMEPFAD